MVSAVSSITSMIDRPAAVAAAPAFGVQPGGVGVTGVTQTSFTDMMAQMATSAVDTLKAGEAASIAGIQGRASVQQVVEAVMSAEQTLQTAIAIRDKVVAAYQEIARMAI
ncbi:flagellar hook-basal body complex protein FliE [Microvirga flocculans]|uniref:Flagellar hook-basal body complex protein FliE n=1 Tax=Microvirga flocculans TaxID=217168 RepID=A0A7W6IG76_9HYPH|nr:flagellar hook-basal body complex protein FliE [Microvirga flocculans]MBB4040749.1 flagellar hook-basal body complex protein FliE [Microvirga flocculans]